MGFIKSKSNITEIKTIKAPTFELSNEEDEFWEDDDETLDDEEFEFEEQHQHYCPPKRTKRLDLTPPKRN